MIFGYSRVSKGSDQKHDLQIDAFKKAGVEKIFQEDASGGRWNRPELQKLIEQLREGDKIVVWKLDRLSRSMKDLVFLMEKINKAGASFQSLTEEINTSTAAGRMMMHMVASFAQFERDMVHERTKAGIEAARKEGRVGGRRPKLTPEQQKDIYENVQSGRKKAADMARLYKVDPATISRIIAKMNVIK